MNEFPELQISHRIYVIRGQRVMIDRDLATLYNVETRTLNQTVKRNIARFPPDFMFQLDENEEEFLRSQIVISKNGRGGRRYHHLAFTELGIAMLSSVLKSEQAVQTNIRIMRTFFELRNLGNRSSEVIEKVNKIEKESNTLFEIIFHRLDELEVKIPLLPPGRKRVGF